MAPYMMGRRYTHMITPSVRLHEKWAGGVTHEPISVASMENAPSFKLGGRHQQTRLYRNHGSSDCDVTH